jgi:hypothetical protein
MTRLSNRPTHFLHIVEHVFHNLTLTHQNALHFIYRKTHIFFLPISRWGTISPTHRDIIVEIAKKSKSKKVNEINNLPGR